jgi:hypothetical protein
VTAVTGTTPAGAAAGDLWFNTGTNQLEVYSSGAWTVPQASVAPTYAVSTYFTAGAQTYTTPANSTTSTVYRVRMVGGGGGGGGMGSGAASGGGGGAGGEFKEFIVTGQAPNTALTMTVGANGTAGGGGGTLGTNGGAGGATSITISAASVGCGGGAGGSASVAAATVVAPGGAGGSGGASPAIAGVTYIQDVPGQNGSGSNSQVYGDGGSSVMGMGGVVYGTTGVPVHPPGTGNGSGGGGSSAVSTAGGVGTSGGVIIERIQG